MVSVGKLTQWATSGIKYVGNKACQATKFTAKTAYNHPKEALAAFGSFVALAYGYQNRVAINQFADNTQKLLQRIPYNEIGKTVGAGIVAGVIGTELISPSKKMADAHTSAPTSLIQADAHTSAPTSLIQKVKQTANKCVYPTKVIGIGSASVYGYNKILELTEAKGIKLPQLGDINAKFVAKSLAGAVILHTLYKIAYRPKNSIENICQVTLPTKATPYGQPTLVPVTKEKPFLEVISEDFLDKFKNSDISHILTEGGVQLTPKQLSEKIQENSHNILRALFYLRKGDVKPSDLKNSIFKGKIKGSSLITEAVRVALLYTLLPNKTDDAIDSLIKKDKDLNKLVTLIQNTTLLQAKKIKDLTSGSFFIQGNDNKWYGFKTDEKASVFYNITEGTTYTYTKSSEEDPKYRNFINHIEGIIGGIQLVQEFVYPKEKPKTNPEDLQAGTDTPHNYFDRTRRPYYPHHYTPMGVGLDLGH